MFKRVKGVKTKLWLGLVIAAYICSIPITSHAISKFDRALLFPFHDETCTSSPTTTSSTPTNLDYAGRRVLTQGQLEAISTNRPVYEEAATKIGIPWQMIAVIHLNEHSLQLDNPANGQGVYQFVDKHGGPYPAGPITQEEFSRQTLLAAEFIKAKASANYSPNRELTAQPNSDEIIKDTFFSYNGRASVYEQQAESLGFNAATQAYEGSPYVMNKADARRDPGTNPTGWGQVKRDHGPIEYPANDGYGAFVVYAALTGTSVSDGCSGINGSVREQVVALAKQELELWDSGQLQPGSGFKKYSQGRDENWCADFVSWVYNQAGYPLSDTKEGNVPGVVTIKAIGESGGRFTYNDASGYTPKLGDIVIHLGSGSSHVNIVTGTSGNSITIIGGNQGGDGNQGSYFMTSSVTQYTMSSPTSGDVTGYVSPE